MTEDELIRVYGTLMREIETALCVGLDEEFIHQDEPKVSLFNEVHTRGIATARLYYFAKWGVLVSESDGSFAQLETTLPITRPVGSDEPWHMVAGAAVVLDIDVRVTKQKFIASWANFEPDVDRNVWVAKAPLDRNATCWVGSGLAKGERWAAHVNQMPYFTVLPKL